MSTLDRIVSEITKLKKKASEAAVDAHDALVEIVRREYDLASKAGDTAESVGARKACDRILSALFKAKKEAGR